VFSAVTLDRALWCVIKTTFTHPNGLTAPRLWWSRRRGTESVWNALRDCRANEMHQHEAEELVLCRTLPESAGGTLGFLCFQSLPGNSGSAYRGSRIHRGQPILALSMASLSDSTSRRHPVRAVPDFRAATERGHSRHRRPRVARSTTTRVVSWRRTSLSVCESNE